MCKHKNHKKFKGIYVNRNNDFDLWLWCITQDFFAHATTQYSKFCILLRRYEYNLRHDVNVNFDAENDTIYSRSSSVQINDKL